MPLYFIYEYIFPCHRKVRKSQFAGRNRAAKAFHRDRAAFISRAGWESSGTGGSYSADKPYHLYIVSTVLRSRNVFICKTFAQLSEKNRKVGQLSMRLQFMVHVQKH